MAAKNIHLLKTSNSKNPSTIHLPITSTQTLMKQASKITTYHFGNSLKPLQNLVFLLPIYCPSGVE